MKKLDLVFITMILLLGCTGGKEKPQSVSTIYNSPTEVVMAFNKAIRDQDSVSLLALIADASHDSILSTVNEHGGFKNMFNMLTVRKINIDTKVIGITSDSLHNSAKVIVNVYASKDSINMNLDSLYFPTVKEGEKGWKMLSMNAQYLKAYRISGEPK